MNSSCSQKLLLCCCQVWLRSGPITIHKVGEEVQISLREGNTGIKMAVSNSLPILRPAYKAGFITKKIEPKISSKGKCQFAQFAFLKVV